MRKPLGLRCPISESRVQTWLDRFKFYREPPERADINTWLAHFGRAIAMLQRECSIAWRSFQSGKSSRDTVLPCPVYLHGILTLQFGQDNGFSWALANPARADSQCCGYLERLIA